MSSDVTHSTTVAEVVVRTTASSDLPWRERERERVCVCVHVCVFVHVCVCVRVCVWVLLASEVSLHSCTMRTIFLYIYISFPGDSIP